MNCVLCQSDDFVTISEQDAKSSERLIISLCNNCGLIFQTPIPTEEELSNYYSQNYRVDYKKVYTPKAKHIYRAAQTALQRIEFLHQAGIRHGSLCDIGAGGGEFTYLAGKYGFNSQGIEPNIGYSEYAKKEYQCEVNTGEINDINGKFDVVTIFHVLEHLPSPQKAFEKLYQLLQPEGVLFVEVPWIETNDASPNNIYFKAHVFYFASSSLIACASEYFDVIKVDTSSNLKILFKAKATPTQRVLPSQSSVDTIKKRISDKGWFEYLFSGKGLIKPIQKIKNTLIESKVKNLKGKEIIDKLFCV